MRFRKKPVVIEAMQFTGDAEAVFAFMEDADPRAAAWESGSGIVIDTLEGQMVASRGDWIIRGVKGEYYPCKPDVFAATYEAVDGDRE